MTAFGTEAPIQPFLKAPPTLLRKKQEAVVAANKRAVTRLAMARIAGETPGTLEQKRMAIQLAILRRELDAERVPCLSTVRELDRKWRLFDCHSAADFRDDLTPRGEKPRSYSGEFIEAVGALACRTGTLNYERLAVMASDIAIGFGEPPVSAWHVRRVLDLYGRHRIIAGRQGSRAAVFDAFPRSTYPTRRTHELWFLDEGDLKRWGRGFCRVREEWVSTRPMGIVIRDHRSGVFPGMWVSDPSRRINPATGVCCETGFDSDDVMAALLSAACPDLAHPALREFAGYLPETLQWDNASSHKHIEHTVFKQLGGIRRMVNVEDPDEAEWSEPEVDSPELVTTRIPPRRPDRNGTVERMMRYMKAQLTGQPSHVDTCIPVDRLQDGEDLGRSRALAATDTTSRSSRLEPVPVRELPTAEQLWNELGEALGHYNRTHVLRRNGMTPSAASKFFMPPRARHGEDLVRMLPLTRYTVGAGGIEAQRDGRSVRFYPVNNGVVLQRGASVLAYVDPLLRCMWLEQGRTLVRLRPVDDVAAETAPGDMAQTIEAPARAASDAAAASYAKWLDSQTSPGVAEEGRRAYEDIKKRPKAALAGAADPPAPALQAISTSSPTDGPSTSFAPPPAADDSPDAEFDPDAYLPHVPPRRTDV